MSTVQVRYIVNDVDAAIAFYTQHLGFHEDMHPAQISPSCPRETSGWY
jgi:catechol 2,3-dioxygenase-like lactoylglutathione lyase family enzyme